MNLEKLFNPRSIAVVGASEENGTVGNVIAKNLQNFGYDGKIYFVNVKYETLFDQRCYKNLNEIEDGVDLAIVAIPAKFVNEVIKNSAEKIKNFVVISAGFGEINEEGKKREEELTKISQDNKLNILGPNCLGFIIPSLKLNASFAGGMPEVGNIALVSQSGALAVAMMDAAKDNGLNFSSVISIGNKMQIDEAEMLEYLKEDKNTKVVGMYLEGVKDGKKFMEAAEKISKPIVILKAGKTQKSQKAIASHTGALAGDDAIMSEAFKELGIIRAQNIDEFLSALKLISDIEKPVNEKVIVVTNAGGLGVLATDAFKEKKIMLSEIREKTKNELRKFLSDESSLENPIDLLGDADEKRYQKALSTLRKEEADTIMCLLTPQDQTPVNKIAGKIINFKKKTDKKIITVFMGGKRVKKAVEKLEKNNIPAFFLVEQAVDSLDKYFRISKRVNYQHEKESRNTEFFQKILAGNRRFLNYEEAKMFMEKYAIEMPKIFAENDADIKFPVALKVDSEKYVHKTDEGALRLNIKNQAELEKKLNELKSKFPGEKIIIQPMAAKGAELILGIKKDSGFGPVIVFGLGGIYTEIFKINNLILPSTNEKELEKVLMESKLSFLFSGARGQESYNLQELAKIIAGLSELALQNSEIKELDINPLIIYNNGEKAKAVDVKVVI